MGEALLPEAVVMNLLPRRELDNRPSLAELKDGKILSFSGLFEPWN